MAARIVVLGSLNMDLVVRSPRFPLPGETLTGHGFATYPGGKGANQAVASARLVATGPGAVAMIGRVGADDHGRQLVAVLGREGVDTEAVETEPALPTGVAAITVSDSGENQIIVASGANAALTRAHIEAQAARLAAAEVVVAQLEVPLEAVAVALRSARSAGVRTLLNAAPAQRLPPDVLADVDVLVVNAVEAATLVGEPGDPQTLAATLLEQGPRAVVVTLGERGALWLDSVGSRTCRAATVEVVDTTASGDAFVGALACALATGLSPQEALWRSCAAGSLAVTRAGAIPSLPTARELEILLSRFPREASSPSWCQPQDGR